MDLDNSPLTMTVAERKRRWAWWKRHYPNVAAWIATHPGEAAGRVLPGCIVRYFRWAGSADPPEWQARPLCEGQQEVSRAEYRRVVLGLSGTVSPCVTLPIWPPTPEKRGRNRNGKLRKDNGKGAFSDFALAGNSKGL